MLPYDRDDQGAKSCVRKTWMKRCSERLGNVLWNVLAKGTTSGPCVSFPGVRDRPVLDGSAEQWFPAPLFGLGFCQTVAEITKAL